MLVPVQSHTRLQGSGSGIEHPIRFERGCAVMRTHPDGRTQWAIFQYVKLRVVKGPDLLVIRFHVVAPSVAGIVQDHGAPLPISKYLGFGVLVVDRIRAVIGESYPQVFILKFVPLGMNTCGYD